MDRYVVIGNPVSHSKSPRIHSQFAEQTRQSLEYSTLFAEKDAFQEAAAKFFSEGGKGANVTVPFKEDAFNFADHLSPQAEKAGAVNTLGLDAQGQILGHNTDGIGLVTDITVNHGGTLKDKNVLVLGAGGATRGIIDPLIAQAPASLCIANRTVSKAESLAALFSGHIPVSACGFSDLEGRQFDWIINATAASLEGSVPAVPVSSVHAGTRCYDLMYASEPTPFCLWSKQAGAEKVMDGLGMLVEQAAESFLIWRGIRPDTGAVIDALRNS